MRRSVVATLATATAVAAMLAPVAAKAHDYRRIEQGEYVAAGVQDVLGFSAVSNANLGAVRFAAGREKFVSVAVVDESGRPVLAEITQDYDGDSGPELSSFLCGSTPKPVAIKPGFETRVYVYNGTCEDGSVSVPTTGTVKAVFTRKP